MRATAAALVILALVTSTASARAATNRETVDLHVRGEATATPTSTAPPSPTSSASLVPFEGTLRCTARKHSSTGMFRGHAAQLCAKARAQSSVLTRIDQPNTRLCAQIYSGPQHATVTGRIGTHPVDVTIERSDGCGTADWTKLQWLLGPPVR
jgi:hypothetical protein